jgi:hypothetical protein
MSEQPDFSTTPRPRRPPAWDVVAVVFGFVALGLVLGLALKTRGEAQAARESLAGLRQEIASLETRLRAVDGRTSGGSELLSQAAAAGESPPDRIVAAIARALPDDARVERLTIEYGDAVTLDMAVVARDASAWDRALARLAQDGPFEEVIPGPERREGEIRVALSARWAGEGP